MNTHLPLSLLLPPHLNLIHLPPTSHALQSQSLAVFRGLRIPGDENDMRFLCPRCAGVFERHFWQRGGRRGYGVRMVLRRREWAVEQL
jgi:hypothetical protein